MAFSGRVLLKIALLSAWVLGGCSLSQNPASSGRIRLTLSAETTARMARTSPTQSRSSRKPATARSLLGTSTLLITVDGPGIEKGPLARDRDCVHLTDTTSAFFEVTPGLEQSFELMVPVGNDRTVRLYSMAFTGSKVPASGQRAVDFIIRNPGEKPASILFEGESQIANLSGDQEVHLYLNQVASPVSCAEFQSGGTGGGTTGGGSGGVSGGTTGLGPPEVSNSELSLLNYAPWDGWNATQTAPNPVQFWRNPDDLEDPFYVTFSGSLKSNTGGPLEFVTSQEPSFPAQFSISSPYQGLEVIPWDLRLFFPGASGTPELGAGQTGRFRQTLQVTAPVPVGNAQANFYLNHILNYQYDSQDKSLSRQIQFRVIESAPPVSLLLSGGSPLPTSIGNVFQIPVRFSAQGVLGTVRKYTVSSLRDRLGMADSENFAAASVLPVPGLPENSLQSVETLSESGTSWTGNPIALATLPANNSHPNGLIAFVDADENLTVRNRDEIFLQGHPIDQCLSGESAPTPCSHFARTSALAFSEDGGSLFIAGVDPQNGYPGVVRRITISQSPTVTSVLTSAILFSQLSTSSFAPRGLVEHAGTIYVSDTDNHVILSASVDSPASTLQVYAGSLSESGDPNNNTGALNQARFGLPGLLSGFTVEGSFFLLVPDDSSSVITRIDTAAATVSVLNPGNSPVFAGPSMAVRGADGFIYVSSPGSYRVFRFDPATGILDRTLGQEENHEHQDGIGLEAAFTGPRMLARAPVGKGMLVMDEPHGVFQGGIRLIQDVPDCPNEASGEVSGSRTFNPGDRCSVSVAIFDPGAYDTLHVELGVEAGGEWGRFQQTISGMPMGLTSEVKMPSALHYDTGKKIMIPLNDTTLSGQGIDLAEFSLIYAEVRSTGGVRVVSLPELETNLSEIVQLAQEGEPQLAARMGMNLLQALPEEPVMMPSEILVARVVNGKPVTGLDLVVIGSRDGSRIMQRLQVDLVPLEDETLP